MKIKTLIITFMILSFLIPYRIKASVKGTLEQPYSNDLWYIMKGGDKPIFSRQYVRYKINDSIVYCIQPGVEITTSNYIGTEGIIDFPYDIEKYQKLELIGYYGYDYPNHQTLEYRMATQALIWEEVSGQTVEFWTGSYGTGNYINIEKEKQEISNLINFHNEKPSFDGYSFKTNVNEEIELIDLNNVLEQYEILESEKFEYRVDNSKLYIKPLVVGNIEIELIKKKYDSLKTIIYKGENAISQNVGFFRISEAVTTNLNIYSYGKIQLKKIGEKTNFDDRELSYEEIPLEGVEFELYAYEDIKDNDGNVIFRKNDLIYRNITDEYGMIAFDNLYIGKYKLKETKTLQEYLINQLEYIIDVSKNDNIKTIKIKNELKKYTVEVPSTGKNEYYIVEISAIILIIFGVIISRVQQKNISYLFIFIGMLLIGIKVFIQLKMIEPTNYIAYLEIPKINLNQGLVDKKSELNNVDKNIQIIKESDMPNIIDGNLILASHSGNSSISYFKNLDKLVVNDIIYLKYNNKQYEYIIVNYYIVDKTGLVDIIRNPNKTTLTLITCVKNTNQQIIFICELVKITNL